MVSKGEAFGTVINPRSNRIKGIRDKLQALDIPNDGVDMGALTYPRDIDLQSGHFIMFHIVEPTPGAGKVQKSKEAEAAAAQSAILKQFLSSIFPTATAFVGAFKELQQNSRQSKTNLTPISNRNVRDIVSRGQKRIAATQNSLVKASASNTALTSITQAPLTTKSIASILIYMPEKITTGYSFQYQGESLRIAAAGSRIVDLTKNVLGGATTLTEAAKNDLTKALGEEFGTRFGTKLIDDLGALVGANVGARAFLEKNVRRVINPHMQFLYRAVNQRTFEYTFQFTAHDAHESEVVDNIIRTFKFFSHPEVIGDRAGRLHGYPAEFDIQYVSRELKPDGRDHHFQENDWLNRVGRCYLSGIQVDYSPTGVYATHRHHSSPLPKHLGTDNNNTRSGNPPTNITMTLTFAELETLNRAHILEGF